MKVAEYQEIIEKTAVFPSEVGLAYCALGLVDELGEYLEKVQNGASKEDCEKEVGDVFWYITALGKELGVTLKELFNMTNYVSKFGNDPQNDPSKLFIRGSKIQGKIKKVYRDNDENKKLEAIILLSEFTVCFLDFINERDLKLASVLEKNYNKLIARRATNTLHGDGDNREE